MPTTVDVAAVPVAALTILDAIDDGALLLDPVELSVHHANHRATAITGCPHEDLHGAEPALLRGVERAPWRRADLEQRLRQANGDGQRMRWPFVGDGGVRWFDLHLRRVTLEGRPWIVLTFRPASAAPEDWLERVFDEAPHGMALLGADWRFLEVNRAMTRIFGYTADELLGMRFVELLDLDDPDQLPLEREVVADGTFVTERRCRHKDGHLVVVRATGSVLRDPGGLPSFVVGQYEDVTGAQQRDEAHRSLEAQLRRTQRMEAVGRLAGGIAHDFNNMLAIILNYADFARRVSADGRARDYLDAIRKGALRAAGLTRQLLIFGRRDTAPPTVVDMNTVVSELERLLRRTLGEDIELTARLDSTAGPVWMALPHAEQVIMNLAVNARDAMPQGGRLFLTTEQVELDEQAVRGRMGLSPGRYVALTVQDTGIGMTDDVLALAFDPFFTTKQSGEASGLGLSIVYGIVQEAGGFIDVKSAPGIGTTFRVLLPVTERVADAPLGLSDTPPQGRGETVLVVEDEPAVRALTVQILRENGYAVQEAEGPETAMELCRRQGKAFDLLLTDVIMPRMSGADLANLVRASWRRTRVLFMSGYASDRLDEYRASHDDVVLLQKPFNGDELLRAMRRILDEDE